MFCYNFVPRKKYSCLTCLYRVFICLRNKTCSPCRHSLMKTEANVWDNSRADQWKSETRSRVFTCSRILKNFASSGYEGKENMFYFFYKIVIFRLKKEKDDKRSAYVYFDLFHETINSHILEKKPTILVKSFFVLHSAMKTHL